MDILVALFGRFHPMLVHFPIALLVVATGLRVLARVLKRPALNAGTPVLVYLAAASAVVSAGAGLALAAGSSWHGRAADQLELHRWLTLAGTVIAVAAALLERARPQKENDVMNTVLLVVSTGLVAAGAHLGGTLVFGDDHFTSAFEPKAEAVDAAPVDEKGEAPAEKKTEKKSEKKKDDKPAEKKAEAKVDFKTQVWPILDKSCIRCHDAKKKKGDLRLDTKAHAMKGGESGPAIVPGKAAESRLYKLITLPEDDDDFMPAKGDPLTKEQRELIRRWIDEGAHWPE